MPASSIGPSWAQRGSREARLAFRQAQKRGDREGAMRIAGEADKQGLASQASIGSAEDRLADQYQGRGADTAITAEIETALTPPGPSRVMIDTPAGSRRRAEEFSSPATTPRTVPGAGSFEEQAAAAPAGSRVISTDASGQPTVDGRPLPVRGTANWKGASPLRTAGVDKAALARIENRGVDPKTGRRLVDESEVGPSIPEQPPAPGASQPPENPVTGSAKPVTGDAEARLGQRRINPLTNKPIGYDPRTPLGSFDEQFADFTGATSESAPQGSSEDESGFLDGVSRLTTPEGGDLTRKAAVEEMNRLRRAAGQTPADVGKSLNALLGRDRAASQARARLRAPGQVQGPVQPPLQGPRLPSLGGPVLPPLQGPRAPAPAPTTAPSLPFRLGQAAKSFSETNLPDAAVAAAEGFARRERSGYERIAAASEAKVDEGIAKARRAIGLATLRVTDRNRRTADTLRRIREEFAAGRTGNPQR